MGTGLVSILSTIPPPLIIQLIKVIVDNSEKSEKEIYTIIMNKCREIDDVDILCSDLRLDELRREWELED
jgi:hypothetical protein